MLQLLAFVLPLSLDSFAISAVLGARRPTRAERWRLSALFVAFEGGMPLVGLALGAPLAKLIGSAADYVAAGLLVAIGIWLLRSGDDDEEQVARRLVAARGWAVIGLGVAISLDELAIGFTLGLANLPVLTVAIAIAVQALVASQLGLALGARIGEAWRERAEQAAAVVLIVLGVAVAATRLLR